jgi:Ca-activated chloride channel homolog
LPQNYLALYWLRLSLAPRQILAICWEKFSMPVLRRSYLWLLVLCFAPLFCWAVTSAAQEKARTQNPSQNPKDEKAEVIRVDTDLVSIEVEVTDQNGVRYTPKLKPEDFVVYEDGVPQKISNFSTTEVPFNLVLLLDTSGSTRDELDLMQKAARRFLNELRPADRVAIIQFNQDVELIKDLTADRAQLEKALGGLTGGSGTSFYDALQLSLDEVFRKVGGRKAIVALTDGVDSYGFNTYDRVLPNLEQAGVALYFLELDTEDFTEARMMLNCSDPKHFKFSRKQLKKYFDEFVNGGGLSAYEDHCKLERMEKMQINRRLYEAARAELREMAEKTGGHVHRVNSLKQLEPAYAKIAEELRMQYSLAYYPTNEKHDGQWRGLRVEVKKPGLTASTKPGYRAPLD